MSWFELKQGTDHEKECPKAAFKAILIVSGYPARVLHEVYTSLHLFKQGGLRGPRGPRGPRGLEDSGRPREPRGPRRPRGLQGPQETSKVYRGK